MIAAGKSKFWKINSKDDSKNTNRIQWAQFNLEQFILHLIEWHKKDISFSEWRKFKINYPSTSVTPMPVTKVAQEPQTTEIVVMPLEDNVTKSEPTNNECFECVPVQIVPPTNSSTYQALSSIPQQKQVQIASAETHEKSGQKRKNDIIYIPDEHEFKKKISNDYISNVKEAMNQFIQTYHLSTSLLRTSEMKNFLSTVLSLGNVSEDEINRMIDILAERT